jgi:hypothetical protein
MLILIFVVIPSLLIIWSIRIVKLFRKGKAKRKSFYFEGMIFTLIIGMICWNLGIFPMSRNLYVKEVSEKITGKSFWSEKEFSFDEISVRGEGYSIDVFKFNDEIAEYFKNPGKEFFENYPKELEYRGNWERVKWKKTPVIESEQIYLENATPHYGNWNDKKKEKMDFVRNLANRNGGMYAFNTKNGDVDFFIISPEEKLIVIINHNM